MTNAPSASPESSTPGAAVPRLLYPKRNRLLRKAEFRKVYDEGFRVAGPCFAAFCLRDSEPAGPKFGFTAPRALGKAVKRNRMKRRLRETLRRNLWRFDPHLRIVFNLRRGALDAAVELIEAEVGKLIRRCAN